MMKHYEMLCVLPGTLAEDELTPMVKRISQVLDNYHAQQVRIEDMGKSRLAYPVKLIRYGYFQLFRFELETTAVEKLQKSVGLIGGFLRVVLHISDPTKEKTYTLAVDPTALSAPQRGDEDRRDERRFERKTSEKRTGKVQKTPLHATPEATFIPEEPTPVLSSEAVDMSTPVVVSEAEPQKTEPLAKRSTRKKTEVSIDTIDKRLDEILQQDIDKV